MRDYNAWNTVVRLMPIFIPGFIYLDFAIMEARQATKGWRSPPARRTTAPSPPAPERVETVNEEMEVEERKAGKDG